MNDDNKYKKYTNHTKSEIKDFIHRCFELISQGKKERVYIFKIPYVLQDKRTYIYLKLKIRKKANGEDVFVLSFHRPEKPLNVLWNDF